MNVVSLILRELAGMFVDDEFLALAVLAVVAVAAGLASWLAAPPLLVGGVLLVGCVTVVVFSVLNSSGNHRT
ncbi:hypothetical protein OOJ09_19575 [Mesorhizobium qingshengii]|uniref:Uncharacterized protein n=1 Tax=Mesorhizobium qingshengii TaxID=1165689 RepID=A0ABT4QY10_9HYPH|nr:hypothetical protein [Mesorhizobium qingshengii]MCZ8546394.1 hypothetical protein [Mesorhizobium qingshengii]